jgi:cytochrome c
VKGTRMSFAGIANDKSRADVIAYLRTLSKNPVALPAQ